MPIDRTAKILLTLVSGLSLSVPAMPIAASDFPVADKVLVEKGKRKLHLLKDNKPFRTYKIALGVDPVGDKEREGDQKTPEGMYYLDMRNPDSDFFLSIRISYPDTSDRIAARSKGQDPGGQIMIHGQPNTPTYSDGYYAKEDWTNGCIAVSNSDMIDIWLMTPNNIPIEIVP
ncbi:MAG: L,D-transpeptidase family protein [Gammaproteobacteria bacterium]|nr:L,D-transpeptidase family protein [Gammaproteobacteria bacterium]